MRLTPRIVTNLAIAAFVGGALVADPAAQSAVRRQLDSRRWGAGSHLPGERSDAALRLQLEVIGPVQERFGQGSSRYHDGLARGRTLLG